MNDRQPAPASQPSFALVPPILKRHAAWLGFGVVVLAAVYLTVLSWRRWPDLIIDFGIQLYLPWRISEGAQLYQDLYYFSGGPFSQYYHALLFKIFGVSFLTLTISNLVALAAMLSVIYRRFLAASDALTASTIGLGIVGVFAFAGYGTVTNYNYLAPYSHEAVHGLLFSIFALACLCDWLVCPRRWHLFTAGFCTGVVFLTKPDIFLALMAGVAAAFFFKGLISQSATFLVRSLPVFFGGGLLPAFVFFLVFWRDESWRESLRSVVFGWLPVFQPGVIHNPFYQWCLGLDMPRTHAHRMLLQWVCLVVVVSAFAAALRGMTPLKPGLRWAGFLAVAGGFLWLSNRFGWFDCGYSLPLLGAVSLVLLRRDFESIPARSTTVFPLLWSIFSLVLLLKMGFFPRIWHYGFVLAMPAFVIAIYLLLWRLPRWLETRYGVAANLFRPVMWLALMGGFLTLFSLSRYNYALKNLPVGQGADTIMAISRGGNAVEGRGINEVLDWLGKNTPPRATLAVLPEGTLINFLSRHPNSTPDLDWNPTMFPVFSQDEMNVAFEKSPPDYICVVEWRSYDFGVGYFGSEPGYGVELMQWIGRNYRPVYLAGSEPLKNGLFGIKILQRIRTGS